MSRRKTTSFAVLAWIAISCAGVVSCAIDSSRHPVTLDRDSDGVVDAADQCPDTPINVNVSLNGCPLATAPDTGVVRFQSGSANLTDEGSRNIGAAAKMLTNYPQFRLRLIQRSCEGARVAPSIQVLKGRTETIVTTLGKAGISSSRIEEPAVIRHFGSSLGYCLPDELDIVRLEIVQSAPG